MKKVIALLLSALMIFGTFAITASAADPIEITTSKKFTSSSELNAGETYKVKPDVTVTVPSDVTLYIPAGTHLIIEEGAALNVLGTIVVLDGGVLEIHGTLVHGENIATEGKTSQAVVDVNFPAVSNYIGATASDLAVKVYATYQRSSDPADMAEGLDVSAGGSVPVQVNTAIKIAPDVDGDEYDDSLFTVYADGVAVEWLRNCRPLTVVGTHEITYMGVEKKADLYRDCLIYLPTGKGYEVVGRNGEMTEDGTIKIKYGTTFSFRLELDPDYDRSAIEVYAYTGYGYLNLKTDEELAQLPALEADEYGYYSVPIDNNKTIQVVGVVSNETLGTVTGIMDTVRNILNMLLSYLKQILGAFGITI